MHQRLSPPPVPGRKGLPGLLPLVALLVAIGVALLGSAAHASPGEPSSNHALNQNVDYLVPDDAAELVLDFPVLVPSYVPVPFAGAPAVSGDGGSYSLYWMNTGGPATFLQVTGSVGGALPAGSPYDLNNELTINASVQGNDAIHDVTPAYDAVWWISGGVLYAVESLNMETDSLNLANSLVPYVGPESQAPVEELPPDAGGGVLETPADVPELPVEATDPAVDDDVEPVPTIEEPEDPSEEAEVESDVPVEAAAEPTAGTEAEPTAEPAQPPDGQSPAPTAEPVQLEEGQAPTAEPTAELQEELTPDPTAEPIEADPTSDASTGGPTAASNVGSDGTGGAPLPVFGGDGTGGTRDLIVQEADE